MRGGTEYAAHRPEFSPHVMGGIVQGPACCLHSTVCRDDQQAADVVLSLYSALWKGESLSAAHIQGWGPASLGGLAKPFALFVCECVRLHYHRWLERNCCSSVSWEIWCTEKIYWCVVKPQFSNILRDAAVQKNSSKILNRVIYWVQNCFLL